MCRRERYVVRRASISAVPVAVVVVVVVVEAMMWLVYVRVLVCFRIREVFRYLLAQYSIPCV